MYNFNRGTLCQLLSCGYLDIEYLERLSSKFEIDFDLDEFRSSRGAHAFPKINDLIYFTFDKIKDRFFEEKKKEIKRVKVKNNLPNEVEYEIFTNCMDSSLYFKDEHINEIYGKWYSGFDD